jgi:hypothetical protein
LCKEGGNDGVVGVLGIEDSLESGYVEIVGVEGAEDI